MTFSPTDLLVYLSARVPLLPGDLLFTGTPAGVGPLAPGDHLVATLGSLPPLAVETAAH
jgi:fumarylpyruvate hydrolase